jgi:hypothetical protein
MDLSVFQNLCANPWYLTLLVSLFAMLKNCSERLKISISVGNFTGTCDFLLFSKLNFDLFRE